MNTTSSFDNSIFPVARLTGRLTTPVVPRNSLHLLLPSPTDLLATQDVVGDELIVRATVMLPPDAYLTPKEIEVIQVFALGVYDIPCLRFYLCYQDFINPDDPLVPNTYTFSAVNELPSGFSLNDIRLVEVFLWDKDPKTSRGTVTTVTPGVALAHLEQ